MGGLGLGHKMDLFWVTMAPLTTSSSRLTSYSLVYFLIMDWKNLLMLLAYRAEACPLILEGRSVQPMILTPFSVVISCSGWVSSQLPPVSAAKSTTTDPGLSRDTCSLVMSLGAGLPGMRAVVITMSTSSHCLANNFISAQQNSLLISFAQPPAPAPDSLKPFTSRNSAPKDYTCSFTAGRVSKARTMAPKLLAVAMAASPATPPPMTRILAGGIFPAAVICPVKKRPKFSAAMMTDLQPAMLAMEERASKVCALVILGIWSMAKEVMLRSLRCSESCLFCPGQRKETRVEPSFMLSASCPPRVGFSWGGRTLRTTSDSNTSLAVPIWAPALMQVWSEKEALSPAPDSTRKLVWFFLIIFWMASGVMATLVSLW